MSELTGKRPLLPSGLQPTPEVAETLSTFRILAELPPDSLGAYVISMAHTASDVLAVVLLQVLKADSSANFWMSAWGILVCCFLLDLLCHYIETKPILPGATTSKILLLQHLQSKDAPYYL